MNEPATDAQAFYTRWAAPYGRLASGAPFVSDVRTAFVDALDPDSGDVVVEMGCGTGANFPYLRNRVGAEGAVVGVDFAAGALDRARDRVERAGWENVHLLRADATDPPFTGGGGVDVSGVERSISAEEIDCIAAAFVSGMFDDSAGVVDDWATVVGPDGRLALLDMARSTHPVARFLNPVFRLFVRLGAPNELLAGRGLTDRLDRRVRDAHAQLHDRCTDARTERHVAGFVRISSGTIETARAPPT